MTISTRPQWCIEPLRPQPKQLSHRECPDGDEGEAAPAVLTPVVLVVSADCERGMRAVSQYRLA